MIKKLFFAFLTMLSIPAVAQRTGTMVIDNYQCQYDTVDGHQIGPGAYYAQLKFPCIKHIGATADKNKDYKMIMHVLKIDMTNPYVKISPYLAKDSYYQINRQDWDLTSMQEKGLKPVASAMGNAFRDEAYDGNSFTHYEVRENIVSDNRVLYDSGSDLQKFCIDANNLASISNARLNAKAMAAATTISIGQVNHHRDLADVRNMASLFCNGIPKSVAADKTKGVDVILKVNTSGGSILVGQTNECTVTSIQSGCGHTVGAGEAILSGIGSVETALKTLKVGDVVNISVAYNSSDATDMNIAQQITAFMGTAIANGEVVPSGRENYPQVAYGCTKDGKTAYICALQTSIGTSDAPCDYLAEAMKNLGVWNSIWVDGGPSADMTIGGKYVTVYKPDNNVYYARRVASAVAVFSTAPDDSNIQRLEAQNTAAKTITYGSTYTPDIYGYNQYGEVIYHSPDRNSQVRITCDATIGSMSNSVFTATGVGSGNIYVALNGNNTLTIPVTVRDSVALVIVPGRVFTGEGRQCQVSAYITNNGETTPLLPSDIRWSTDADMFISSCEGGLITPFMDGTADVRAEYSGLTGIVEVTVENLDDPDTKAVSYKKDVEGKYYVNQHLVSVPTAFNIELLSAPNTTATIHYTTGDYNVGYTSRTATCHIDETGKGDVVVNLDYNDVTTYPVTINYVDGTNTTNIDGYSSPYVITNLESYYNNYMPSGIAELRSDSDSSNDNTYNTMGARVSDDYHGIIIKKGRKFVRK